MPQLLSRRRRKVAIPIVYGTPAAVLFRRAAEGRAFLGGCIIEPDQPTRYCPNYGHVFDHRPAIDSHKDLET